MHLHMRTCIGQAQTMARALEQGDPEGLFKRCDLPADRRLG